MPYSEGLHHILYMSQATRAFGNDELLDLLQQCQLANAGVAISGVLVYGKGNFLQLLEGPQAAVDALFKRIQADERHTGVVKLADKPIRTRSFSSWSMAFRARQLDGFMHVPGYLDPAMFRALTARHLSQADLLLVEMMQSYVEY